MSWPTGDDLTWHDDDELDAFLTGRQGGGPQSAERRPGRSCQDRRDIASAAVRRGESGLVPAPHSATTDLPTRSGNPRMEGLRHA